MQHRHFRFPTRNDTGGKLARTLRIAHLDRHSRNNVRKSAREHRRQQQPSARNPPMPIFCLKGKYVLFIHIPKCGGTSIENALKEYSDIFFLFHPHRGDLPTSAQHFHKELLQSIVPNFDLLTIFIVVRHPVSRAISEYFHDTRRFRKNNVDLVPDFNLWMMGRLKSAEQNPYISDNHLRRQVEFLLDNTVIFHFEDGLENPIKYGLNSLGSKENFDMPHEKNWGKDYDMIVDREVIDSIESFYKADMDTLGYDSVSIISPGITCREVLDLCSKAARARDQAPLLFPLDMPARR